MSLRVPMTRSVAPGTDKTAVSGPDRVHLKYAGNQGHLQDDPVQMASAWLRNDIPDGMLRSGVACVQGADQHVSIWL